jgi:hypothetical protein
MKFGTLTKNGLTNVHIVDLNTVKSSDPLAFAYGQTQAKAGVKLPSLKSKEYKDLAPEYIRGYKSIIPEPQHMKRIKAGLVKATEDGKITGIKLLKKEPVGFKRVNHYFVDSSGFGTESEPALTQEQFLKKIRKGFYYGITSVGQFQVYVGEYEKI